MKKFITILLAVMMALTLKTVDMQGTKASGGSPDGTVTVTQDITFGGQIVVRASYPSKIWEGEDLPVTFKFVDGGFLADNIDKLQINDPTLQWLYVTSFSSSSLSVGETSGTYYYNTSGLTPGTSSTVYGLDGVRYDKFLEANDVSATTGGAKFTFAIVSADNTAPVITGGNTVFFANVDTPSSLASIKSTLTAIDETDGNVTGNFINITDNYSANSDTLGDYITTWNVSDSSGNTAQTTVTVRVVDIVDPTMTIIGSGDIYLEVLSESYSELGVTISDNYDSGLTPIITGTVNTSIIDVYYIHYNVSDSSGNAADDIIRAVHVVDTTKPVISLTGASTVNLEVHNTYSDLGSSVSDNYYSLNSTVDESNINVNVLGSYTVYYNSTDGSGNVADTISRTVNVIDTTIPVITLNGSSNIIIEYGDYYSDDGFNATDNYYLNLNDNVVTSSNIDYGTLGIYSITYDVTDGSGNIAAQVVRTIEIVDSSDPIINVGDKVTFNSLGETLSNLSTDLVAYDVYGGNLSASIIVTIDNYTGNENIVGTYTVTYEVSDVNGNTTTHVMTVIVNDDLPPVISASEYLLTEAVADVMTQAEIIEHMTTQP